MVDLPIESGVDESQAAPRKIGHARLDLILALSAIFISAVSLVVAIQNAMIQRELVAGSTWPFVQRNLNANLNDAGDSGIGVSNDGVGPAKIRSVEVFFDGKPVGSPRELLQRCCGLRSDLPYRQQMPEGYSVSIADNTVLRAGEQNTILRVRASEKAPEIRQRFEAALTRISFRGCYCSVLDQCWTSDLSTTKVKAVAACPAPEFPFDPLKK